MSAPELVTPSIAVEETLLTEGHFQPRSKTAYMMSMFRTLSASSRGLMHYGSGSLPHRIVEVLAQELARLSFSTRRLATQAVREAAYRAFYHPELFPYRYPQTRATGLVEVYPPLRPLAEDFAIRAGDSFATRDGRTVQATEDAVLRAGESGVLVPVVSDLPGLAGNIPAGEIASYLHSSAVRVRSATPILGGLDRESDAAILRRFRRRVFGIQTANTAAVLSAAENARVDDLVPWQVAIVKPWRVPGLNREMGYAYVVVDAGAGSAPSALVQKAQDNIELVQAAGQDIRAVSCSPYVVDLDIEVELRRDANAPEVERRLRAVFAAQFENTPIEDGAGRGKLPLFNLKAALDAVPGVVTVFVATGDVVPPVGGRAVAGRLAVTFARGLS